MNSFPSIPPAFPSFQTSEDHDSTPNIPHVESNSKKHEKIIDRQTDDESMSDYSNNSNNTLSFQERLGLAWSSKDEGVRKINENDIQGACEAFTKGLSRIENEHENEISEDLQQSWKELRIALNLNTAFCHIKLKQWFKAISSATVVLNLDPSNVKALYRRGFASSRVGQLSEARKDLTAAYKLDNENNDIRKELQNVKQLMIDAREKDKKAYSGWFVKTEGLYNDQQERIAKQKLFEKEQREKEMMQYEKTNAALVAEGKKPYQSFEEWKTAEENKSKTTHDSTMKPVPNHKKKTTSSTCVEFDEEDEEILKETKKMGYCYFNRPKDENIAAASTPAKLDNETQKIENESKKSISKWNAGGTTYEEFDCTPWFSQQFERIIKQCCVETPQYSIKVDSIKSSTHEAYIVVLRSSKRYLYDTTATILWTLIIRNEIEDTISGSIVLLDVSSSKSSDNESSKEKLDLFPEWLQNAKIEIYGANDRRETFKQILDEALSKFKKSILQNVQSLEESYRLHA